MRLLLGFGHKARHGKDSAAQAIKNYAYKMGLPEVRIFKFADALYELCRREYGMTEKNAPLLQMVGLEKRKENPNYWIDRLRSQIDDFSGIALVTDVRFTNEAAWIKSFGGFLINVTRLNDDGKPFVASDRAADHPSETDLNLWNWDGFIRTKSGQETLAAEQALTLFNYFLEITSPVNA